MGCFPYACPKCGGAYERCAQQHQPEDFGPGEEQTCHGDQFCWEDNVVVQIGNEYYAATYTGYGSAELKLDPTIEVHSEEFEEYFASWGNVKYVVPSFTCASCFIGTVSTQLPTMKSNYL